nr:hypothetical protein [Tanacetum cinerariifolium]
ALRRSDNENMLGLVILILRSILTDLQKTSKGNGGRYEHANPVSLKAQDGGDHITMNRDYAWLMISRHSISSQAHVKEQANVQKSINQITIHKI